MRPNVRVNEWVETSEVLLTDNNVIQEVTGWSVEDFYSACSELSESEPLHSEV